MSKFRTINFSTHVDGLEHVRFITAKTPNLKGRGDICAFIPPGTQPGDNLPVAILMHGVYGSAWNWVYNGNVHLAALTMIEQGEIPPMILAMPSDGLWGDGSGYLPHNGYNFEKWITEDILNALIETVPGATAASPLFIAGLSMGGFGALRIGAKYGHLFKAMAGHSSITSLPQMKLFVEEDLAEYAQSDNTDEDVLATVLKYKDTLPPMRFDCGETDLLIEYNRELHQQLTNHNIAHSYAEHPGEHEWPYWSQHIQTSLKFFAEQL
ncbi:esterase family protein [Mucilaginibacter hurinus]|uniref:Esterase family protein n=1 Tax=Mucilaginibacter hurinus TaxID=2201324 RepID=A0A367GQC7_9SPHI|nr:alpha/beta hydrolase-fold protein [Mucilaginibacter hurinus]RCH55285.1 esterase family protein [Mucilaginibacter hurinus]